MSGGRRAGVVLAGCLAVFAASEPARAQSVPPEERPAPAVLPPLEDPPDPPPMPAPAAVAPAPEPPGVEEDRSWRALDALSWGTIGIELLLATSLTLRFTVLSGDISEAADATLWIVPPVVGPGFGVAQWWVRAPGSIARGLHGGLWTGIAGGLLAGLLDAAFRDGPGIRFETAALIGLFAGSVPGLLVGATQIDTPDEGIRWLGLPPAGLLAGIVVAGVVLVGSFLFGDDPGPRAGDQILGWTFFGTTSIGLSAAMASVL